MMNCSGELILKIGCNEYEEISNAIANLLCSCSIGDEKFVHLERQIQPTSYFASFTTQSSMMKIPIQCQSLSCVIFLPDEVFREDCFQSIHLWNFHHKIELLNEFKQSIARQDYYELAHGLPLWSVSHMPFNQQIIVRFNIFTQNFPSMLRFYQDLFQRKPDSSKPGFVLFHLSSAKCLYQLSIKYSPSIQSYSISQSAYLKFHLPNLQDFLHQYTRKLFTINQFEYYIYDPDGNLLHLCLHHCSSPINELLTTKVFVQTTDSGFGDSSSDPSRQIVHSSIDGRNHSSSNDSGQNSSISSIEPRAIVNTISVRSAKKSEVAFRFRQQQQTGFPFIPRKTSLYESEPRLSMNHDISYTVDSPRSPYGYLNAFLLKKQRMYQSNIQISTSRPKSVPISDSLPSKSIFQRSFQHTIRPKSTVEITNDEKPLTPLSNSRINIGITLDSRLRKTPVFDMLRSSMMEIQHSSSKTSSHPPIARF